MISGATLYAIYMRRLPFHEIKDQKEFEKNILPRPGCSNYIVFPNKDKDVFFFFCLASIIILYPTHYFFLFSFGMKHFSRWEDC